MNRMPKSLNDITDDRSCEVLDYTILKKEDLRSVASHRHSFLELSFITGGAGEETVNGERHPLARGSFTLLLPCHVHEIYSSPSDPLQLYNIAVSFKQIFGLSDDFGLRDLLLLPGKNPSPFFQMPPPVTEKTENIMADMLEEYTRKKPWSDTAFQAGLAKILICFNRLRLEGLAKDSADCASDLIFWKLVKYIYQHHSEDISLSMLQDRYGIRSDMISRLFFHKTGIHFHDFLNEIRVTHACSLLASSDMTVTDIAAEAGFNSYVTFSKIFRKNAGQTALQYRHSRADAGKLC